MEIIEREKAVEKGLLSKLSPIYLIAKELRLKYLVIEHGFFTGPAVGLSVLVDKILSKVKINSFLDLCCGTGALTKIALRHKVKKIVALDINTKVFKKNIKTKKVKIIEKDIFDFQPTQNFDLVVIDAPREILLKIISKVLPKLKQKSHLILIWHGSCEEFEWNEKIREKLRKIFSEIIEFGYYGEEITLCVCDKIGMEIVKKL